MNTEQTEGNRAKCGPMPVAKTRSGNRLSRQEAEEGTLSQDRKEAVVGSGELQLMRGKTTLACGYSHWPNSGYTTREFRCTRTQVIKMLGFSSYGSTDSALFTPWEPVVIKEGGEGERRPRLSQRGL